MVSRLAKSVVGSLTDFVGRVGADQSAPGRKFLQDALTGLVISRDSKLSEWSRALQEPTDLIHTEKRLSRWMGSKRFDDEALIERYLEAAAPRIRDHLIVVDSTDIQKTYGRRMPYLEFGLRDGSRPGHKGRGWNLLTAQAVGAEGRTIPLAMELYSTQAPNQNTEALALEDVVRRLRRFTPANALWVLDRGYDAQRTIDLLEREKRQWLIRSRSNQRKVYTDEGGSDFRLLAKVAPEVPTRTFRQGKRLVEVGWASVWLASYRPSGTLRKGVVGRRVTLVVSRMRNKPVACFLTNRAIASAKDALAIHNAYRRRWRIEDTIRYSKQSFALEDVRLLRWRALRRLFQLALLAFGFLAFLYGERPREMAAFVERACRAFRPTPDYMLYRFHDALSVLLMHYTMSWKTRGPPSWIHARVDMPPVRTR